MDSSKIAEPTSDNLAKAAGFLRHGDLVGVPTETVYGLAANATDDDAVAKIYAAKKRPPTNPLIVHAASADDASGWCELGSSDWIRPQFDIAAGFWPGPLTVIVPRSKKISKVATAGGDTVGIRVPDHPVALALLRQCRFPLAAPSANPSNYISPTTAMHVAFGLGDQVRMIIDGGPCQCGIESTIIKLEPQGPILLRAGGVSVNELETAFGHPIRCLTRSADSGTNQNEPMLSPGQFPKHYSPSKPLLIAGTDPLPPDLSRLGRLVFAPIGEDQSAKFQQVWTLSKDGNLNEVARNLFAMLREADQSDVRAILIDACEHTGIGQAIMDRINRAASP
ncbi:Threonylcarbamoyl-AMP synthase [Rubripirellula obstinata]|uniref:Threonylcarbamoyl-AMP synthase n=1 Tax=Rubripirellula obstinata TaxID=406547 RepID=A0A5B1CE39_9BACT|nr:L-threonylcarbamoyladenylate synthase [Rubripirellula obstinata]KAA1257614.1 Threonylcarbamoyl-AMP synthase [Rubripirellula obstinata]